MINIEPLHLAMTAQQVIAASEDTVYVWSYRQVLNKAQGEGVIGKSVGRRVTEFMFNVDVSLVGGGPQDRNDFVPSATPTQDPIASIAAIGTTDSGSARCLVIARESGTVQRYSLPHLVIEMKFVIQCRPQVISLNCDGTRMSVIDISGVLTLYEMKAERAGGLANSVTNGADMRLDLERKDVWNMKWADDNPELFAILEKTRMYVVRGTDLEEPVLSSAYICQFNDLQIRSVLIDDVVRNSETPRKEAILDFETKSLRDTRDILEKVPHLKDALAYVEENQHPRLWRLVADAALDQLNFPVAEKAFVCYGNYQGIQFVKKLRQLEDVTKQKAEVAVYHQRFDEAEALYAEIDRKDLAIELRVRLGDWFRVIQLASTGEHDALLSRAYEEVGDYYADRGKWQHAAKYYKSANNNEKLVKAYYILEEYDGLNAVAKELPEGDKLLKDIGKHFASVGLCEEAHFAFLRGGEVMEAVDTCVLLNQWALAVELAQQHNLQSIESLLTKYANHLLEKERKLEAVQLYRKANRNMEAAKLITEIARELGSVAKEPLLYKKLYLLAALEMEKYKNRSMPQLDGTQTAVQTTLNSLITQDQSTMGSSGGGMDKPWRGAEACHFFILAHTYLYRQREDLAMGCALRCTEYEDILDVASIYSLLALAAYQNKFYGQCSKAFIRLENATEIPVEQRKRFSKLAVSIFLKHAPKDPSTRMQQCPKCNQSVKDWHTSCPHCYYKLDVCIISGRPIFTPRTARNDPDIGTCKGCKRRYYVKEIGALQNCALCHTPMTHAAQRAEFTMTSA
jgi:WD repeat-containing protein 35